MFGTVDKHKEGIQGRKHISSYVSEWASSPAGLKNNSVHEHFSDYLTNQTKMSKCQTWGRFLSYKLSDVRISILWKMNWNEIWHSHFILKYFVEIKIFQATQEGARLIYEAALNVKYL